MPIIIRGSTGIVQEGILLAAGAGTLRVIMPSSTDVLELNLIENTWRFPNGETAEIEALIAADNVGDFCSRVSARPEIAPLRVRGAGASPFSEV